MNKKTGIYIHIPFCQSKCSYCDFLSGRGSKEEVLNYFRSLTREIELTRMNDGEEVDSIFFGGGTPSLAPVGDLVKVIETLKKSFNILESSEVTIECNPGTLTKEKLFAYKKAGINRLSFGLQSANDYELKMLGRIHNFSEFRESFIMARDIGFDNISVDLMESIPGQTMDKMMTSLDKVLDLAPDHISAYSLILEEGTRLYENSESFPPLPDEEMEREIYYAVKNKLKASGFIQYEVSNFAKEVGGKSFACKHNIGYWDRANYYGFGLGAASLVNEKRYSNVRNMKLYNDAKTLSDYRESEEVLSIEDSMAEFIFLGFRKNIGIDEDVFYKSFGKKLTDIYGNVLKEHILDGTIKKTDVGYALTDRGMDISNYILSDFL